MFICFLFLFFSNFFFKNFCLKQTNEMYRKPMRCTANRWSDTLWNLYYTSKSKWVRFKPILSLLRTIWTVFFPILLCMWLKGEHPRKFSENSWTFFFYFWGIILSKILLGGLFIYDHMFASIQKTRLNYITLVCMYHGHFCHPSNFRSIFEQYAMHDKTNPIQ